MKTTQRKATWARSISLIGLISLISPIGLTPARADSFQITNCIASAVAMVSWPTNSAGTNGLPQLTGGPINVDNVDSAGLAFSCVAATNTNTTVTITLLRSVSANPPSVAISTNGLMTQNDWETSTNSVLTLAIPVASTITAITNSFTWYTNLGREFVGGARWIGVWSITNNGTGSVLTNCVLTLHKKIIPVRFP